MKKLLVVISFLTLFMVAHAALKDVAVEYLTAEQVSPGNGGLFGEVNPEQWRLYGGKELQTMNGLNLYDFHARWQDYATCWFTTQDPLAEKYYALSPYTYCAANPLKYTDSSGKYIETLWDVANVALGIGSFVDNVKQGNVGDAVLDGLGVVVDAAAVILPGVPGGAGAAIKGARAADDVVDAVKSAKAADKATEVKKVHGNSKASTKAQHAYDIIDKETDKIVKTGVSSGPKRKKDGKSARAEMQVRKWNKEVGSERYISVITHEEPSGPNARDKIYKYEKERANEIREQLDKNKHIRP